MTVRVALVAGVARPPGIGRATALRFATAGYHVVCADLVDDGPPADTGSSTRQAFDRVVAEVEAAGRAEVLPLPRTTFEADDVVGTAVERFGRIDACCALGGGTGKGAGDGLLLDLSDDSWQRCLDLNLTATWQLVRATGRTMRAQGTGAIVALSSHAASRPSSGAAALGAARAAVQHLVAAFAEELAPYGVRCNAVSPLAVAASADFPNPGLHAFAARTAGSTGAWLARTVPLGRAQDADETAAVVEFLCSNAASFVTGVTVPVHGGAC